MKNRIKSAAYLILALSILVATNATTAPAATDKERSAKPENICPEGTRQPWLWPFDWTSAWNTPIGTGAQFGAPTHPMTRSLQKVSKFWVYPGIAMHQATPGDPLQKMEVQSLNGGEKGVLEILAPAGIIGESGPDKNVVVIDPSGYRTDQFIVFEGISGAYTAELSRKSSLLETGVASYDTTGKKCVLSIGTRAFGGDNAGGLIRKWELEEAGSINHAIALDLSSFQLSQDIVWPASCKDRFSFLNWGAIPYGQLFAIPPDADITTQGLSSYGQKVGQAMQRYGAYVVDRQGAKAMSIQTDQYVSKEVIEILREDFPALVRQLRPVLNNTFAASTKNHAAGGGQPIAPHAPPMCYKRKMLGGGRGLDAPGLSGEKQ